MRRKSHQSKEYSWKRAKAALKKSVLALGPEADRQGLTEEKLMKELEQIKKQVYQKIYGNKKD